MQSDLFLGGEEKNDIFFEKSLFDQLCDQWWLVGEGRGGDAFLVRELYTLVQIN